MTELYVVPGDRHVERLAREGKRAETRSSLRARLGTAFLPDVAFVDARASRLVLGIALADPAPKVKQMDLFAAAAAAAGAEEDPLLATVRGRGGASWARLVAALDDALSLLRGRGATAVHLRRVADRGAGVTASRARTLAVAMEALDERLARASMVDGRLIGARLAEAIGHAPPETVATAVGAKHLRARWLLNWEPVDLAWWRALDEKLTPAGGGARVMLPSFDRPLEGARDRDPLEVLAEDVARGLDAAPETEAIPMMLGDLTGAAVTLLEGAEPQAIAVVRAADAVAQARAAVAAVTDALDRGAAVERVAIGLPVLEERTIGPLRRALDDAAIIAHESRGAPPSASPVVTAALLALEAAGSLERIDVAQLFRSGYVDPARFLPDAEGREADRALGRLARALETSATAAGDDAAERLIKTARASEEEVPLLTAIVQALVRARAPSSRGEHVSAARTLWTELGLAARSGRGGLATFGRDEAPVGVARAERLAIARDARAWDVLVSTLDTYEQSARAAGGADQPVERDVFRSELVELLDAGAAQPGAGRAGAVRVSRLADLVGDSLDLLVVLDVNEGILPRDESSDPLVSEALAQSLARASRGAFSPPATGHVRARELAALATAAGDAKKVVLCFTREDAGGAPLEPSAVVDALVRAGIKMESAVAESPRVARGETAERALREREREAFFLDPARPRSDVVGDLGASARRAAVAAVLTAATGGAEKSLSVTGVERFARCPFMGYAYVVLAAREAERREELPDAREEGTLVHEALAAAFTTTHDLWARRPRDETAILQRGLAAAEGVLAASRGHAPLRAVVQLRVRDAVRALLQAAIVDDAWNFELAEQSFGPRGRNEAAEPWPPHEILEDGDRLVLRGTVDRIDRGRDGTSARVVDYKRSKTTVRGAAGSLGETALQVPLYACVVSRRLGLATTGAYVPTQPRDILVDAKPNAKLESAMADLVNRGPDGLAAVELRTLDVIRSARRGLLAPLPADDSECRTCAVSGGCRKPRFAMAAADEGDEA